MVSNTALLIYLTCLNKKKLVHVAFDFLFAAFSLRYHQKCCQAGQDFDYTQTKSNFHWIDTIIIAYTFVCTSNACTNSVATVHQKRFSDFRIKRANAIVTKGRSILVLKAQMCVTFRHNNIKLEGKRPSHCLYAKENWRIFTKNPRENGKE